VNASRHLATFCPDTLVLRTRAYHEDLRGMFISSKYEESVDTCRKVLAQVPRDGDGGVGHYVMLSVADDAAADVPLRKVAFAYLAPYLGVALEPVQHGLGRLPTYDAYQDRVRCALRASAAADARLAAAYEAYKAQVLARLPLPRNDEAALRRVLGIQRALFAAQASAAAACGGSSTSTSTSTPACQRCPAAEDGGGGGWLPRRDSIFNFQDTSLRQKTASRNYYAIQQQAKGQAAAAGGASDADHASPASAASVTAAALAAQAVGAGGGAWASERGATLGVCDDHDAAAEGGAAAGLTAAAAESAPSSAPLALLPPAELCDELNALGLACAARMAADASWPGPSNAAARCMLLLFVTTVRNGARSAASWPSMQELRARMDAVRRLLALPMTQDEPPPPLAAHAAPP
jgi:hypothetical protein